MDEDTKLHMREVNSLLGLDVRIVFTFWICLVQGLLVSPQMLLLKSCFSGTRDSPIKLPDA